MKIKKLLLVTMLATASLLALEACGQTKDVSSAKKTTTPVVKKVN